MEYPIENPSSDAPTPNFAQSSVGTNEQAHGRTVATTETEFFSSTFEERLRSDEAFLRQTSENLEQRRDESARLHNAHDEMERLVALEVNSSSAEQQTNQATAREQKLLADIDALHEEEAQQRHRIEKATAATRRISAEEFRHADAEQTVVDRAEYEETEPSQLEGIRNAAESEAGARAAELQLLSAEIKALSHVASEQIDRMDQAKARLAILEELRVHAEAKVCERAEREIRLEAEIDALRQIEATQVQRIEAAEEEVRRLTEEQARVRAAADAKRKAEAEARQRAAAEVASQAAVEAARLAEEEESELEHLETIRARAEAAAQERAEKERLLNSQLLAFGEAAAEQLKRIETAEAELNRANDEHLHIEEKARQTAEQLASRASEVEIRRKAAAEEIAQVEAEVQSIAKEEEQHLAELEAIRSQAEAEAEKRSEVERELTANIEMLRESEARQRERVEAAQGIAQRMLEEETERRRITAEEEEQRLIELEAKRDQAEAEAEKRAEVERGLNADIETLRESEARQLQRIKAAQDMAERMLEGETERLRIAEEDEQRLIELEAKRTQCVTMSQRRQEEEQRLTAEIEALTKTESEQVYRITAPEVALRTRGEKQAGAEVAVSQEDFESQTEPGTDTIAELEMWPSAPRSYDPTLWSMFEPGDQTDGNVVEEAESPGNGRIESPFEETENVNYESSSELSDPTNDSVATDEGLQAASPATPVVRSLAQRLVSGDREEYDAVMQELGRLDDDTASSLITCLFDDSSEEVRSAAARALFDLNKEGAEFLIQALHESTPERRTQIVAALNSSGLGAEAIDSLAGESSEKTHDAFSILFSMAKAGEVQSLFQTIEKHPNIQVRLSVIKLLTFTNRPDIIPALRSLAVRGALPIEVRSALMKSIYEMSSGNRERSRSAA